MQKVASQLEQGIKAGTIRFFDACRGQLEDVAIRNADFLLKQQLKSDGGLFHSYKKGKSSINGYLEDYAFLIKALINLYEATGRKPYLHKAFD